MKQKIKKYIFGRVLCVIIIVISALVMAAYGILQLSGVKRMNDGNIPHIGSKTYIAITDDQFSDKVKQNALVFGTVMDGYQPGDIAAVSLNSSDLVTVIPNTCADIAVVQIVSVNEGVYSVAYNDTAAVFHVTADAVLCGIGYQVSGLGTVMEWMMSPMSFLFWLVLPLLVIVLCIVIIAYLKEKYLRSVIAQHKIAVKAPQENKNTPKTAPVKKEEPKKNYHPLLSGEETEPSFPAFNEDPASENATLAQQISQKIAAISDQEQKDRENLNQQLNAAMDTVKKGSTGVFEATGKLPSQPKTTVVYQVGEQKTSIKQEENISDDDLDLMMLQDKIENIIINNNRRLENEVEQKLRGLGTEKEKAQRELEKTREFFISSAHLNQSSKEKM